MLLVPGDPLNPRRVDPHFAAQAAAARESGIAVARIDHDALDRPDEAVAGVPAGDDAVYRGWMMTASEYDGFAKALDARRVTLRTSGDEYRAAHELPGWYEALRPLTPESAWTDGPDLAGLDAVCERLGGGPAVLRDHVKSMKHYWDEAAYIPDVTDRVAVQRVAARFLELRGDAFTGGFVLRRFEEFTGAEARTWWIGGSCALITPHPDTPDELPDGLDLVEVEPLVTDLALPFVTVDLVRRTDGAWRIVELGDGQVSDWPGTRAPADLMAALF
ncbi:ATP-grasp domain-containing protein [Kribbella catacumbae]|uniref:ATP-grasp domain-containing protein n=1 Tax=Kribbella catacumbae TaxID=460086 RepID=UPI000380B4BC|nr:ATP-grasp domain-containing protein [Kribbella catacumbae]